MHLTSLYTCQQISDSFFIDLDQLSGEGHVDAIPTQEVSRNDQLLEGPDNDSTGRRLSRGGKHRLVGSEEGVRLTGTCAV